MAGSEAHSRAGASSASLWRGLAADPWVRATVVLLVALAAIVGGFPLASTGFMRRIFSVAFVMLALLALLERAHRLHEREERGFWNDLAIAMGCWLAVTGTWLLDLRGNILADILWQGFYAFFYAALFLAIERRPYHHHRWRPVSVERTLNVPTALLAVFGLFLYFPILPLLNGRAAVDTEQLASVVYLVIDTYLVLRLSMLLHSVRAPRWRMVYGLVLASTAVMSANHLLDLLVGYRGAWASVAQVAWKLPSVFLLLAARTCELRFPAAPTLDPARLRVSAGFPGPLGHTMIFALIFPLFHYGSSRLGFLDPAIHSARETLMICWVALFGAWAALQYQRLSESITELHHDRARTERTLRQVESDLRLRAERQETLAAQRMSLERFAQAFQTCPDSMAITRLSDNVLVDVNPSIVDVTGYLPEEVIGQDVLELGLWASPEDREAMLRDALRHGTVLDHESRFRKKSGELSYGLYSATLAEMGGKPYLFSITRDITHERRDEAERARKAALFEEAACAVVGMDGEGRVDLWNAAASKLFGRSAAKTLGRRLEEIGLERELGEGGLMVPLADPASWSASRPGGDCVTLWLSLAKDGDSPCR